MQSDEKKELNGFALGLMFLCMILSVVASETGWGGIGALIMMAGLMCVLFIASPG